MNALIEIIILAQNQQHYQRHVNVMRRTVRRIVQRLQNWYHQLLQVLLDHDKLVEALVAVQQQVQQQGGRIQGDNATQGVVQTRKVDFEGAGVFFGRVG
jgi:GTP1/Obg family GTP-binding protein